MIGGPFADELLEHILSDFQGAGYELAMHWLFALFAQHIPMRAPTSPPQQPQQPRASLSGSFSGFHPDLDAPEPSPRLMAPSNTDAGPSEAVPEPQEPMDVESSPQPHAERGHKGSQPMDIDSHAASSGPGEELDGHKDGGNAPRAGLEIKIEAGEAPGASEGEQGNACQNLQGAGARGNGGAARESGSSGGRPGAGRGAQAGAARASGSGEGAAAAEGPELVDGQTTADVQRRLEGDRSPLQAEASAAREQGQAPQMQDSLTSAAEAGACHCPFFHHRKVMCRS